MANRYSIPSLANAAGGTTKKQKKKSKAPKHWIRTPLEQEMGTSWENSEAKRRQDRREAKKKKKSTSSTSVKGTDKVTGKKNTRVTQVTKKDTKTTAFMKRGGAAGWLNRKRKRLSDKLKVASKAFKKG
tara:strand:- start:119 stop:505 length:387 start_codon:yes stop_codon:yes gene_type:complete